MKRPKKDERKRTLWPASIIAECLQEQAGGSVTELARQWRVSRTSIYEYLRRGYVSRASPADKLEGISKASGRAINLLTGEAVEKKRD